MTPTRVLAGATVALLTGCASLSVGGSRYLATGGPDLSTLTVANEVELLGPFSYETHAMLRRGATGRSGSMLGIGADLSLLAGQARYPYLIGGLDLGLGTRDHPRTWSSWSAGIGMQLMALGPLGLRAEGRYRRMSAEGRAGLELGIRIGRAWDAPAAAGAVGERGVAGAEAIPAPTPEAAGGGSAGATRAGVVELALGVMGTPYQWGGSDANGFDCSGLIQYAYGQLGVALPRRSVDQAQSGVEVRREVGSLLPGDILTFATQGGGAVSHVGLYLGSGRFIHSATGGVQVSLLDPDDPYGRWWWQRWIGARRVVE